MHDKRKSPFRLDAHVVKDNQSAKRVQRDARAWSEHEAEHV